MLTPPRVREANPLVLRVLRKLLHGCAVRQPDRRVFGGSETWLIFNSVSTVLLALLAFLVCRASTRWLLSD